MSRRNLLILILAALASFWFYRRLEKPRYARVLTGAMTTIENHSLAPVKSLELFEGAMDGMLGQLDDYSTYISPEDLPNFQNEIDLQHVGLGIRIAIDPETKQLKVVSPVANSPALRAGIRAGDRILRIGKTPTEGMSVGDAAALLGGEPGTSVTLSILHEGAKKPVEITVVREVIQEDSVLGDTCNADGSWNFFLGGRDRIGYVRIVSFDDETVEELRDALAKLTARGMRGLVLDLRDNPGGYLDAAVDVCNLFVRSGVIVTTRRRDGSVSETFTADGRAPFTNFPMAVVVDQETASAAEIVAACLQDHHRATVVGQRTFGKGTVQEIIYLEPGCGAMKLTTASYWRPSGRNIDRSHDAREKDPWGVSPEPGDEVVMTDEEFDRWQAWRAERDILQVPAGENPKPAGDTKKRPAAKPFVDVQLLRAVERVEKKLQKDAKKTRLAIHLKSGYDFSRRNGSLVLCQSCFDRWHSRPRLCELPGTAEGGCATRTCRFIHQTTTDRALGVLAESQNPC